jgi:phosphoglycolate phosphatase
VGFDLDMTLVDSAQGIATTLGTTIAALRGTDDPGISADDVWPWVGLPLDATVAALAPELEPEVVIREYRARYATIGIPLTSLLPGAREALLAVKAAGGRVLVVSAKAEAGVREVLAAVGLDAPDTRPDLVVGDLFGAAKGGRLLAAEADVYVGDHPGDVRAARVAGAVCVAVVTGPQPEAALVAAGADVVLTDLTAFPRWLSSYLP